MMRKIIFIIGYIIINPRVLIRYYKIRKFRKMGQEEKQKYQFNKTKEYLIYAYENTSYYKELFDDIRFNPYKFKSIDEITAIPILTKSKIKERPNDFLTNSRENYNEIMSGGSTGEPLKYRISKSDAAWSRALLLNGFNYSGYKFGDSILTIAGGSLVPRSLTAKQKLMNFILNQESISTLNMREEDYRIIIKRIKEKNADFLRGYSSSLYRIGLFIINNNITLNYSPRAIFTTSETLEEKQREIIENAFKTKVYDQYGLNDSGASAFEISKHTYLLDFERNFTELINDGDSYKIIATSYSNRSMIFIRYDTGDNCLVENKVIQNKKVLSKILGRATESLKINGVDISIPRLTIMLGNLNLNRFQIIQREDSLQFNYSGELTRDETQYIDNFFLSTIGNIEIKYIKINDNEFMETRNGKHRYIINES